MTVYAARLLTRIQRWGRRTLASNRRHLPPNPTKAGAITTRSPK